MVLLKGNAIAKLKPVSDIDDEVQRKLFFTFTQDFEEIKPCVHDSGTDFGALYR